MILETPPSYWSSVHRPIEFVYDHEKIPLVQVLNSGGFARFWLLTAYIFTPVAGEKIYINSGEYNGEHTITSVSGQFILTETAYTTNDLTNPNVKYIRLPQIKVYAGYLPAEEYPDDLPLTLVATFTPENSPENDIQFDVSEYLKSIFRILPPVVGIDFNMFNRFRLYFDGVYHEFYMVLNSSITTAELNEKYVDTGAYLNSRTVPIVFGCGNTILSTIAGSVVVNNELEGVPSGGDFNNDFNDDFNIE